MDKQLFVEREFLKRGMVFPQEETGSQSEESFCTEWFRAEQDDRTLSETELRYQELAEKDAVSGRMSTRRWKRPARRKTVEEKFLEKYRQYVSGAAGAEWLLNDLIDLLGQLCTYVIHDRIGGLSVYQSGDEEDITQEGHGAAFEKLMEDRISGCERSGALYYYTGIYRKKTMDYLRFYGLLNGKKPEEEKSSRHSRTVKKSDINAAWRMEDMMTGPDGEEMPDRRAEFSVDPFEDFAALEAQQSRMILRIYLQELMDNTNIPAAPLAVMYARILYQMERLLDPARIDKMVAKYMEKKNWADSDADQQYHTHLVKATEEIQKFTTATSPIWAMERMGTLSIGALGVDSETSVRVNFDASLGWGSRFTGQLSQPAPGMEPAVWADVVYTEAYGKSQIENWAADIHNATVTKTARCIVRDANLLEYVMDECNERGRLKKEIRKRIQQSKKKEGVCR